MENQKERTGGLKLRDEGLDAALERLFIDLLARAKRKVLLARSGDVHQQEQKSTPLDDPARTCWYNICVP